MEIKVAEINALLDERRGNWRFMKLMRIKLTRIFEIRVNSLKRYC